MNIDSQLNSGSICGTLITIPTRYLYLLVMTGSNLVLGQVRVYEITHRLRGQIRYDFFCSCSSRNNLSIQTKLFMS